MKTRRFLYFLAACTLVMAACPSPVHVAKPAAEVDIQEAVDKANQMSQDLLAEVSEAVTSGDFSGLRQFLAEEDRDGELEALLARHGVTPSGKATPRGFAVGQGPSAEDLQDGDTLLFRGDGTTWQNQLMRLVYPGFYHHAGVFDEGLSDLGAACVVSATIDADDNGLCFQTLEEVNSASVAAARLRYFEILPPDVEDSLDNYIDRVATDRTYYAFVHLNLDPVSRFDETLWYCSKVPWRIYWDAYPEGTRMDTEGGSFYDDPARFEEMKDSYLYRAYLTLLRWFLPRRYWGLAEERAEAKLRAVLSELISPDELRVAPVVSGFELWGEEEPEHFPRGGEVAVTGVSVEPSSIVLGIGQTQQLSATILPFEATNQGVSWTSSDDDVAKVNSAGLVTAVAAGTAFVTVTTDEGPYAASCVVTVSAPVVPVTGVNLAPASLTLVEGGATGLLIATITPADATNKNVSWSSSNPLVAAVVADGREAVVDPLFPGTAMITVTTEDRGFSATCEVTVEADKGTLHVTFRGEPADYFDSLDEAQCRLVVVDAGEDPEDPDSRVVDQTFKTTAGGKVFDPVRLDTYHYGYRSYDVYCWFDVGPDEGVLDDGDHSVWRHLVDITVGEDTDVELDHQVLTGFILWDLTELYYLTPEGENPAVPDRVYWHEFHVWVALVVPVMEVDSEGEIVDLDFIDLEDAGVLDDNTSYLGFAYRRALRPVSGEPSWGQIRYALDITGLKEILDDAGGNPDCDDLPYNPCYLLAFMEPELVPGEEGALSDGDVYGFYGYPGQVIPIPPPWGLNVYLDGGGLSGYDIGLTERMWP